ncbi:Uncharacterized protein APZ42_029720 [Daphnia magna]|uniref:Uncharacterized protein n=1 Tax=Daphnia magna TaxID=35525 RepID=A0A164PDI1_9CRUS|nr:Uncharacterized protein APZ42_029720 [Daphnia magna]
MQKTIKINTTMIKTFETQVSTQEPAIIISAKQTPENTSIDTSEAFSITIELPTTIGDQSPKEASTKLEENESLTKCATLTVVQEDLTAISYYENEDQVFPKNIKINSLFSSTEEIQTHCHREPSNIKDTTYSPTNTTLKCLALCFTITTASSAVNFRPSCIKKQFNNLLSNTPIKSILPKYWEQFKKFEKNLTALKGHYCIQRFSDPLNHPRPNSTSPTISNSRFLTKFSPFSSYFQTQFTITNMFISTSDSTAIKERRFIHGYLTHHGKEIHPRTIDQCIYCFK